MKFITLFFCAITLSLVSLAQVRQPLGKINVNTAPGGIVYEINELEPVTIKGSYYLLDDWYTGDIVLENGLRFDNLTIKYNLETSRAEIKVKEQIKALDLRRVKTIRLFQENQRDTLLLENGSEYTSDGIPVIGILETIVNGDNKLVVKHGLKIKKPTMLPL